MLLQARATTLLLDALLEEGLQPERRSGAVQTGAAELSARVASASELEQGRQTSVQLGLELSLDAEGRYVVFESVVGVGDDAENAARNAVAAWIAGVWRPARALYDGAASAGTRPLQLCTGVDPDTGPVEWLVHPGPVQTGGEHRERLAEALERQPPYGLVFPALARLLEPGRPHWVRLVGVRQRDLAPEAEVRLDNQPAPQAAAALAGYPFPSEPGYLLFRQFLILKPAVRPSLQGEITVQLEPASGRPWWRFWE